MAEDESAGLRIAGFSTSVLGGLFVGLGSLLTWATVGLRSDAKGVLDSPAKGVDLLEGKVALAAGVALVVAVTVMRASRSVAFRRTLAALILVAGVLAGGIAVADAVRGTSRFGISGAVLDRQAGKLAAATGEPVAIVRAELRAGYRRLEHVALGPGLFLVMAGAALGIAGGALGMSWASRGGPAASGA